MGFDQFDEIFCFISFFLFGIKNSKFNKKKWNCRLLKLDIFKRVSLNLLKGYHWHFKRVLICKCSSERKWTFCNEYLWLLTKLSGQKNNSISLNWKPYNLKCSILYALPTGHYKSWIAIFPSHAKKKSSTKYFCNSFCGSKKVL